MLQDLSHIGDSRRLLIVVFFQRLPLHHNRRAFCVLISRMHSLFSEAGGLAGALVAGASRLLAAGAPKQEERVLPV